MTDLTGVSITPYECRGSAFPGERPGVRLCHTFAGGIEKYMGLLGMNAATTRALGAAAALTLLFACGDDVVMRDGGDTGPDTRVPDIGTDVFGDADPECRTDEECDDDVPCTRNICDDSGNCRNPVDPAVCDDGIFCNGVEQCDPRRRGCVPGPLTTCSDGDVCTIDRCDEEEKICRHLPRDFDEDGEADWNCEGGTDCDDRDPTRGGSLAEICDDDVDNDCDEVTDEAECGRPMYDVCEDALDVSAGGFFELSSRGATPDYSLGCAPAGRKDIVLTFTLATAKNVTVRAEGGGVTYVALRTDCADRATETQCASGFPGTVRVRGLEAGTYFAIVADIGGDVGVEIVFEEPTPPPTNEDCTMPLDVSAGGTFAGTFVDVRDDVMTSCGSSAAPDLVYQFTLASEMDVVMTAIAATGDSLSLAVRSTCTASASELRCTRGSPAGARLYRLAAGTYFVFIEGSASREVDFNFDIEFLAATDPPPGDTCDSPIVLSPGSTPGTLADKQDDLTTSCGFFFREAVYQFTLASRSDVTLSANASGPFTYLSVRTDCDAQASALRCTSGNPSRARLRDLAAGTYFVLVESFSGTGFTLDYMVTPPTTPTVVPSTNDTCDEAFVIPATGGLFQGNTDALINDYTTRSCGSMARSKDATFVLNLTARKRVFASTEGSAFDTVLHLHTGVCASGEEEACDDDGGDSSTSVLDRVLEAGTHYFIVDGWGLTSGGDYFLEVLVSEP